MTITPAPREERLSMRTTRRTRSLAELAREVERPAHGERPAASANRATRPQVAFTPTGGNFRFPEGFLFGAATSAHQVEGHCTHNDWWAWEQDGRVGEASGTACDHYHRFREDFDLARELGHNCHRLSIEWSRIEPEKGVYSAAAIRHYRQVLEALRERGLEPIVTLYHFTLPQWLAAEGGWENPAAIEHFHRFVGLCARAYSELAHRWITLNEPMAYVFKSYVVGEWPPGKRDYVAAVRVVRHLLRAHVGAYTILHEHQPRAQVSVAQHLMALTPCDPGSWRDRLSVRARDYLLNHLFVDALHRGFVHVPGLLWEQLARPRTLDFLGVNYYTRDFVHNTGFDLAGLIGGACSRDHGPAVGKRNGLGWEVYPEGLGELIAAFRRYQLPILISENGVATESDADRWGYIYMHLWQVARALGCGVPVIGYLYWSLLDNFEWAEGYRPRFGLVEVDYATQQRRVRPSARLFQAVIERNQL